MFSFGGTETLHRSLFGGLSGELGVQRQFTRSINHYDQYEADGEQMKLETFTLLISKPIHKEPVDSVDPNNRHHHDNCDTERSYAGLAQQRYVKSHRIFAKCRCIKDFRRFRNSQIGDLFRRSVLGA